MRAQTLRQKELTMAEKYNVFWNYNKKTCNSSVFQLSEYAQYAKALLCRLFFKNKITRRVPSCFTVCTPPYVGTFPYGKEFAYIELCADVGNLVGNSRERWILEISVTIL